MPNRILKDTIHTSPNLNALSPLAERHFYRLLPVPDDFGCFEATALVVKGKCYPLRPEVKTSEIDKWHQEMVEQQIIRLWKQDGRQFGQFLNWDKHQRVRSLHQRKTPEPPSDFGSYNICADDQKNNMQNHSTIPFDDKCQQVTANDGPNPNPNPNLNPNPKEIMSCKPDKSPLDFISSLKENPAFKHVDIDNELHKMDAWFLIPKNKRRKKTSRFILNWLSNIEKPMKIGDGKSW